MTSPALLVRTLSEKLQHVPSSEDPFFARGKYATQLQQQAIGLAYFGKIDYEDALKQIHQDFSLQGTPHEGRGSTKILARDTHQLVKYYEEKTQGKSNIVLSKDGLDIWANEKNKTITLTPRMNGIVEFKSVNLITGRVTYYHELEDYACSFEHFLTLEDYKCFMALVNFKSEF